jgi:hypothetical protein
MISEEGTVEISFAEKDKRYDNLPAAPSARDNKSRKSGRVPGSHNLLLAGTSFPNKSSFLLLYGRAWMREATECPGQRQYTYMYQITFIRHCEET